MGDKVKIGLALGGGAARGLAHIGVLEVFAETGIPIDIITGTSIGAIIGAIYARGKGVSYLKEKVFSYMESEPFLKAHLDFLKEKDGEEGEGIFYKFSNFLRRSIFYTLSMTRPSFITGETFRENLDLLIEDIDISRLKIPFAAVALDIEKGQKCVFTAGSLRNAVAASCALPGILPPVEIDGRLLVDGGWIDSVPIEPARVLGADVVIGVVVRGNVEEVGEVKSGLDIVTRSDLLCRYALTDEMIKDADLIISPDVGHIHWADFSCVDEVIDAGRKAGANSLEKLRKIIKRKKIARIFRSGRRGVKTDEDFYGPAR